MANRKTAADRGASRQQGLFDSGPAEGSLDMVLGLKQLLSKVLREGGYDRWQVAMWVSRSTGKEMSKDSLDKYLSSDPAYQPSCSLCLAICVITDNYEPYAYQLEYMKCSVLGPEDRDLVDLARKMEQRKLLDQEIMQLQAKRGLK